jgi:hypothetical protein
VFSSHGDDLFLANNREAPANAAPLGASKTKFTQVGKKGAQAGENFVFRWIFTEDYSKNPSGGIFKRRTGHPLRRSARKPEC